MSRYAATLDRLLLEGEALIQAQRFAEGEERARAVLAQQPRNPGGHYLLALSSLMQARPAEALPHIEGALRTDRVNPKYHFMAGLCHSPLGQIDAAMAAYRRALQYLPEFFEARANLGFLLECEGRIADAAECYRRVLAGHPHEWYSLNRLGYCERLLGRPEEAVGLLQRALELRPDFAPTHNELALALVQLQRTAEAIPSLRRAVELDPAFLAAWANLGKVLYLDFIAAAPRGAAAGAEEVVACFDRILELDPGNTEFAFLRGALLGEGPPRPPEGYVEAFFDRFAAQFEAKVVGELAYDAPRVAAEALRPHLEGRTGLTVLDLGCGTGLSGGFARAHAARLVGIDLSAEMLERARALGLYDEVVRSDIASYLAGVPAASVDLAIALDVFIYVGEIDRVLGECRRVLAPRGLLAFSVELPAPGQPDFALAPSGRYVHGRAHVLAAAERQGLVPADERELAVRHEAGRPVPALLLVFGVPA